MSLISKKVLALLLAENPRLHHAVHMKLEAHYTCISVFCCFKRPFNNYT